MAVCVLCQQPYEDVHFISLRMQMPGSVKILETVSGADRGNKIASLSKRTALAMAVCILCLQAPAISAVARRFLVPKRS